MSKIPYSKVPLTYSTQLSQLKQRGLIIENDEKAIHLLEKISYYRLSGYWYPLLGDKQQHIFKPDASLNIAFRLYCFDRELRYLVLGELEKIEIAIRAKMTYVLSQKYGAFWFQQTDLFSSSLFHTNSLSKMKNEFERSDEEFIRAFREKYTDPLPPSWMAMEITSFGILSMLYKNLKSCHEKREIAHYFGLADSVFETWLHSIVYLRNVCAHHTRLWNRVMTITPQIPRKPRQVWLKNNTVSNKKTYFILSMIAYLLQTVNPNSSFKIRFKKLLENYPNIDIKAMGFSQDWDQENLWA